MSSYTQHQQVQQDSLSIEQKASLNHHVQLQQHQEDFLKWLETHEVRQEIDQYAYKKIR